MVYIWDLQSGDPQAVVQKLAGHEAPVLGVSCHPGGDSIVSCAIEPDRTLKIWRRS